MHSVIEFLFSCDVFVFRFFNSTIANPAGDWFFPFITNIRNFYIVYGLSAVGIMIFGKKKGVMIVLLVLVVITAGDQISSFIIKPLIGRVRPCSALDNVRLLIGCPGGKSFPSSHAVNNFAVFFVLSHFYKKAKVYFYIWASLVSLSRIYVGVHYPSDLIGGALLGTAIAWLIVLAYEKISFALTQKKD